MKEISKMHVWGYGGARSLEAEMIE